MSYQKTTTISGTRTKCKNPYSRKFSQHTSETWKKFEEWQNKNWKCYSLNGHWSSDSIKSFAKKMNLNNIEFSLSTADLSGKGRGGNDGRFKITKAGNVRKS